MFEIVIAILTFLNHSIQMQKIQHILNWMYGLFGKNYRVATLSTFSLTVTGIIIPSLKVIGQF